MTELVFTVTEEPDGGFSARAIGQSIFTEADDMESLRRAIRDAVRCHFDPGQEPRTIRLQIVREEVLAA